MSGSASPSVFGSGRDAYLNLAGEPDSLLHLIREAEQSLVAPGEAITIRLTGPRRHTPLDVVEVLHVVCREGSIKIDCSGELATLAGGGAYFADLFDFLRTAIYRGPQTWEFLAGPGWVDGIDPGSHLDVKVLPSVEPSVE